MSVWVTRSAPDNLRTARQVRAMGHAPLMVPLIGTVRQYQAAIARQPDLAIFTSVHAVRHFARHRQLSGIPVLVASAAAAEAALAAGHSRVTQIDGDDRLIEAVRHIFGLGARLLLICGACNSGALARRLQAGGCEVEAHAVYRSEPLPDERLARVRAALDRIDAIVLHSRSGAGRITPLLQTMRWRGEIYCISRQTMAACSDLAGVDLCVAEAPSEPALMDLMRRRMMRRDGEVAPHRRANQHLFDRLLLRRRGCRHADNDDLPTG